ncbi:MAG TPA: class I SAM-dependent methyltransferase [Acidimicrobiales bacterium]|nr:class I SAM-dependent methyltransferase [Acidimicrobiales bacterium]
MAPPPPPRYDTIGRGYAAFRQPDPHIAAQIWAAVGDAARILNVGAGTGSYEPPHRHLVAVEPSAVMVDQRGPASAPVVRAAAEALPFPDRSFDVALAMMTVHHWADLAAGLAELRRVADRQVIFTFDPDLHDALWVFHEYVTAALGFAAEAPLSNVADALGPCRVEVVPVPADCTDGFASAYWRRPERYLSPSVRASISAFARLSDAQVEPGMTRLREDLASGTWHRDHAHLLQMESLDAGLRLVVAGESPASSHGRRR